MNKQKTKQVFKYFTDSCQIILGTIILAFGINVFLIPNNIMGGGFTGLSQLIQLVLLRFLSVNIHVSIVYLIINLPLYILAFKIVNKRFFFMSLIGTISYSLMVQFVKVDLVVNDLLLASIYCGVILGIGCGIAVRADGATGGTSLLGIIINYKKPGAKLGQIMIFINIVVIGTNVLLNGMLTALYSVIIIFLEGVICDYIVDGQRGTKAYYVISEQSIAIAHAISTELKRGVTRLDVTGQYSLEKKQMLFCICTRNQIRVLKQIVFSIDNTALMFSTTVNDVVGNGFTKYVPKKQYRLLSKKLARKTITHTLENINRQDETYSEENLDKNINKHIENSEDFNSNKSSNSTGNKNTIGNCNKCMSKDMDLNKNQRE